MKKLYTYIFPFAGAALLLIAQVIGADVSIKEFPVPSGSGPHDVAPAPDGRVWFTAQSKEALGVLDPASGKVRLIPLGEDSRPHGVIVGRDGNPWVTDGGLNAIVRVDSKTEKITVFSLPSGTRNINMNTAAFDKNGKLWFTGQNGYYGRLDPVTARVDMYDAPKGRGPYGMTSSPDGFIYFVSLAGDYAARINPADGRLTLFVPPNGPHGTRRVWADSKGVLWISGWNSGKLLRLDPGSDAWSVISLRGGNHRLYGVYVDDRDNVWVSDYAADAFVKYEPSSGRFTTFAFPTKGAEVKQMLGRRGELWGAESENDKLVVVRY